MCAAIKPYTFLFNRLANIVATQFLLFWYNGPVKHDPEELFFPPSRKESREEAKSASRKDRSKYKKTNQKRKKAPKPPPSGLLSGRVLAIFGQRIVVDEQGTSRSCVLAGALKKEARQIKNLVTVGDIVHFNEEGAIVHVEERYSVLSRADNLRRRKEQLIAANIDQVLITASVTDPSLKPGLIDRYIIAAMKGNMEPIIVINKMDMVEDQKGLDAVITLYRALGFTVVPVSATNGEGIDDLLEIMAGRASVFSGQSGVGKSSLINAVTGLELKVGEVVEKTAKGAHTTTRTELIPLDRGGWCIDTPGIRSFGVWELSPDEVRHYYQEMMDISQHCKYANCSHTHEPGCAVIEHLKDGKIDPLRYDSYRALLASIEKKHKPR